MSKTELAPEMQQQVQALAERLIPAIRETAQQHGYAIGVHGSLRRDIDLIAVPWTGEAVEPKALVNAIFARLQAEHSTVFWHPRETSAYFMAGCPGGKDHGRLVWTIHLGGTYIDLSVMPRGQAVSDAQLQMQVMAGTLNEIAIALNDWFNERRVAHEQRAVEWRQKQDRSVGRDDPPWIYAEETIRRDEAETLDPLRKMMRAADRALAGTTFGDQ